MAREGRREGGGERRPRKNLSRRRDADQSVGDGDWDSADGWMDG